MKMLRNRVLSLIVHTPIFGKYLKRLIIYIEGGQTKSQFLRYYAEKNNVRVGMHTYGGCFDDEFNIGGKVSIGRYCSFAKNVIYLSANHPVDHASMSPYFYNKQWGYNVIDVERNELVIGNDVWVGYGSIILGSCNKIGNGAVIGAGSIVTKDVEPYTIVCGNPAKQLRKRFNDTEIQQLETSKWYEMEPAELMEYYNLISNPKLWADAIIDNNRKI